MPGEGWLIEKDEATAARRTLSFQLTSQGTTPLTAAPTSSSSSIRLSINGAAQITPAAVISAISAGAGMYGIVLLQSNVSVLGNHGVWWDGPYSQYLGSLMVVNSNPMSSFSNIASVDYTSKVTVGVGIAAPSVVTVRLSAMDYSSVVTTGVGKIALATYSGVTVGVNNVGPQDVSSVFTVGVGIAAPSKLTVQLQSLDYSSKVTVGAGIAAPSLVTVQVSANNDKTGYGLAAGTYSGATVGINNIAAGTYSGVTVGAGDYAAKDMTSKLTVGAGIAAPSALTVQLQSLDYTSKVTVGAGLLATSAIPAGAFQANSIDNVAVKAGVYSGVTVGAGDYAAKDMSSALTVGAGIATPSLVTVQVQATSVVSTNVKFLNNVTLLGDGSASSFHV